MAIKHESIKSRKDMIMVNPRKIKIIKNFNPREEFEYLDELKNSIIENGVLVPIRVKIDKNNNMILIDGERRLRATILAIKEGYNIEAIPAILERKTMKTVDMLLLAMTTNTGRPLNPFEEANAIKRLLDYGLEKETIAKKLGKSNSFIDNRMLLLDVSPTTKEAIKNGEISMSEAIEIVRKTGGDEIEELKKVAKSINKKKSGIKKISKKDLLQLLEDIKEDLKEYTEYKQLQGYVEKIEQILKIERL